MTGELTESAEGTIGLCLIRPDKPRWHACPGCAREGESPQQVLERLLRVAGGGPDKGSRARAIELDPIDLYDRYGIRID